MNGTIRPSAGPRGQPLLMLVALLAGWIAVRTVLWQSPFPALARTHILGGITHGPERASAVAQNNSMGPRGAASREPRMQRPVVPGPLQAPNPAPPPPAWQERDAPVVMPLSFSLATVNGPLPKGLVLGDQLVLAAALSHMELPLEVAAYFAGARSAVARSQPAAAPAAAGPPAPSGHVSRWSADAWLLVRRDTAGALAAGEPSYGRSQAGAVLRYRLVPSSGHRPIVYARATRALAGSRETEVAAGLAARPISGVPVSVAGEVRTYEGPAGREVRPAAFAVTELPPARLPLGLRGEAYAQAGYVGGRFATAFVDGQARVDAKLEGLGRTGEVRFGGGMWGGAQKHAARLDVGPSATIGFRLGQVQSRVAVDYRWRVAGDAQPASGPTLTISAGF